MDDTKSFLQFWMRMDQYYRVSLAELDSPTHYYHCHGFVSGTLRGNIISDRWLGGIVLAKPEFLVCGDS